MFDIAKAMERVRLKEREETTKEVTLRNSIEMFNTLNMLPLGKTQDEIIETVANSLHLDKQLRGKLTEYVKNHVK